MRPRRLRWLLVFTAAVALWTPRAFGHETGPEAAWVGQSTPWPGAEFPVALAAAGGLAAGGILLGLAQHLGAKRPRARHATGERYARRRRLGPSRTDLRGWLTGAVLALTLWALPSLSLHDTHHAFEKGAVDCTVAQIVHHQGAGVLPSTAALIPPVQSEPIALPAPLTWPSRIAPAPAARSPPA